jgi:hypothetical protein
MLSHTGDIVNNNNSNWLPDASDGIAALVANDGNGVDNVGDILLDAATANNSGDANAKAARSAALRFAWLSITREHDDMQA